MRDAEKQVAEATGQLARAMNLEIEIQNLLESKQRLESHRERWSTYPEDRPNSESVCTLIEESISLEASTVD